MDKTESRKQKNRQIERKKRSKQRTAAGIFFVIVALIAVGIGYAVWDSIDRRTVVTFQGERIPTSDFRFLHMMVGAQPGDEFSRESAVTQMLRTLSILERAEQQGISVPAEEMAEMREEAAETREWVVSWQGAGAMRGTSANRIADFASVGNLTEGWDFAPGLLFEQMQDEFVPEDFRPDQGDIDEFLEELLEDIINASMETTVQYIAVDEWDIAWAVYAEAADGADFAELISLYHVPHEDEDEFENPMSLQEFISTFQTWDHWTTLNELEIGDITEPMMIGDNERFFVVRKYASELSEELQAEITENVIESFIADRRLETFMEMIDGWVAAADYTLNERALARF